MYFSLLAQIRSYSMRGPLNCRVGIALFKILFELIMKSINKYSLNYAKSWKMYYTGEKMCLGELICNFSSKNPIRQNCKKRIKFLITSQNITQMHTIIDRHRTQRFCLIQFSKFLAFCFILNFLENMVKSRKFPPVLSWKLFKLFWE